MTEVRVLSLPGWQNSGPQHWLSRWELTYGYQRVEQHDWQRPLRGDWVARLEDVLLQPAMPTLLVAHGLACLLVAAWAAHSNNTHLVQGALLVAPTDAEREALRPVLPRWSPIVLQPLPFKSILVSSRNDPQCSDVRARQFARAWGADVRDAGAQGALGEASGVGDWPQGQTWMKQLLSMSKEN